MSRKAVFYILDNDSSLKGQNIYACRIIEKAFNNNHKIYVHTANLEEAQNFDNQLWIFRDISFIPHEIYTSDSSLETPVLIGYNNIPQERDDILVNLTIESPASYQHFNHIIEVVPHDDNLKTIARKRFKIYKEAGYNVEVFNV